MLLPRLLRRPAHARAAPVLLFLAACGGGDGSGPAPETGPFTRYAYLLHAEDATVLMASVDFENGQLRPLGYVFAGAAPSALAVDPAGRFVFVANSGSDDVSAWTIDDATGLLTEVAGSPFAAGDAPASLALDPTGGWLYVANAESDDLTAFAIDPATGALSAVPGSPYACGDGPRAVSVGPDGLVFVADELSDDVTVFTVSDVPSGALAPAAGSPVPAGDAPVALAVDPASRTLVAANALSNDLSAWSFDVAGACTPLAGAPFAVGTEPRSVAAHAGHVYVGNVASNDLSVFSVSAAPPATLVPHPESPFEHTGFQPHALHVEPTGHYLYTGNGGSRAVSEYAIDPLDGGLEPKESVVSRSYVVDLAVTEADEEFEPVAWSLYVASDSGSLLAFDYDADGHALRSLGAPLLAGAGTTAVAVDPRGRFVFAANNDSHDVAAWTRDADTGALAPVAGSPFAAGIAPEGLAVELSGRFLYVANGDSDDVTILAIGSGGELAPTAGSPVSAGTGSHPKSITIDPSGRFLYVACESSHELTGFELSPLDGSLTPILGLPIGTGLSPSVVTADARGEFLFLAMAGENSLVEFEVNAIGGLFSSGISVDAGLRPEAMTMHPEGEFLFLASERSNTLSVFEIPRAGEGEKDKTVPTPIPGSPFASGPLPAGLAVDAQGKRLFLATRGDDRVRVLQLGARGEVGGTLASASIPHAPRGLALYSRFGEPKQGR